MREKLQKIRENAIAQIENSDGLAKLNDVRVAVLGKNLQYLVCNTFQCQILFTGAVVGAAVLKSNRIGKNIGSDNRAAAVVNISTGTFDYSCFCGTCLKFADIIFPLYDLQTEKLPDQDR